jgi:hypothetical protein
MHDFDAHFDLGDALLQQNRAWDEPLLGAALQPRITHA